jgi:flagellin-like protein
MKANRRFVNGDDAVSPVIAVILMVAITVVLAATVYMWVSGFSTNQANIVQASFGAKAVDLPWSGTDSDTADDAIQITYVSGSEDLPAGDITISIDGSLLTWDSATRHFTDGAFAAGDFCTTSPGGDADDAWERGGQVYFIDTAAAATLAAECTGSPTLARLGNLDSVHQLTVAAKGQVILDTSIEVHDNAGT